MAAPVPPGTSLAQLDEQPQKAMVIPQAETSSTAVAAREKAAVEARFLVAMHRPRDLDTVRVRLVKRCQAPRFAEHARYSRPIGGKKVYGPSIRFVEEALRLFGNVDVQTPVVYDDNEKRVIRVSVTDLETNTGYSQDVTITKTVERRNPKQGDEVIRGRQNSTGQMVYQIVADEDALLTKQGALVSKAIRGCGLRVLPSDLVDEGQEMVQDTVKNSDAQDPEAARKRIANAFFELGVMPHQLAELIGHSLEAINPAELQLLRSIYVGIKDGETTWQEALEEYQVHPAGEKPAKQQKQPGTEGLRSRLGAKAEEPPPPEPPAGATSGATSGEAEVIDDAAEDRRLAQE